MRKALLLYLYHCLHVLLKHIFIPLHLIQDRPLYDSLPTQVALPAAGVTNDKSRRPEAADKS